MIDYDVVKNWNFGEIIHAYTARDTMLYALGIGMGADPLNESELRFVYEGALQAVPTMVSVLGTPGAWLRDPRTGADYSKMVHGEQSIRLLGELPPEATVVATNRVVSLTDKGAGKGAIAVTLRRLREQSSGDLLAESRQMTFLRGDGGFSEKSGISDPGPEPNSEVPDRAPDIEVSLPTLDRQALLYRLSGDFNPLHSEPAVARAAGFTRPILHGLCTYGMAAHALLKTVCGYRAERLRELAVRFTAPVYPGETIRFQLWRRAPGEMQLRARIDARDVIILNNGLARLHE
jgi:acyl dehydratase